ncbi:MAG: hypothetical protein ACRD0O_12420, partial [Acidimicrobiia bacterium]
STEGSGGNKALPLLAGIGLATLAVGYVVLKPSKAKQAAKAEAAARESQSGRHRSRSTPKQKR